MDTIGASNGTGNGHDNWDEQRERLSAYVDGELPTAEAQWLEAHLESCEACRRELAELRQVRALLRALPQPRLPRSFTLPETGPVPVPVAIARREREDGARRRSGMAARIAQRAGGVVAAAGLALVLGSGLVGLMGHGGGGASTASMPAAGGASSSLQSRAAATATGRQGTSIQAGGTNATRPASATDHATGGPTPTATPTPTTVTGAGTGTGPAPTEHAPVSGPTYAANESSGSVPIAPLTGAGLIVAGGALLIGGRAAERRQRRQGRG